MTDTTDIVELTPEAAAAIIAAEVAQRDDPEGFAKMQALAAIDAQYAPILSVADDDTRAQALSLIDGKKAEVERQFAPAEPVATPAEPTLDLPTTTKGAVIWSASQHVEPVRDSQPWCTWEDAERMLKLAALAASRGAEGVTAKGYRFKRDEAVMTLTLELV